MTLACLILAAKYFCETEDVVVNIDICRMLGLKINNSFHEANKRLTSMELKLLSLMDWQIYVSPQDYNSAQHNFNAKIKQQKVDQLDQSTLKT